MDVPYCTFLPTFGGSLARFRLVAGVIIAENTHIHVPNSFGHIPRNGIARSYNKDMF